MTKHLNMFVQETFKVDGVEKSNYTKVGAAFPHKTGEGYSVVIIPGVSVTGNLALFPPSESNGGNGTNESNRSNESSES